MTIADTTYLVVAGIPGKMAVVPMVAVGQAIVMKHARTETTVTVNVPDAVWIALMVLSKIFLQGLLPAQLPV